MLLIAAFAFSASAAFAQDLTSKKGEAYLPAAGDWSIGIDATPVLNYVGGFLSSAGGVAPTWDYLNSNQAIIGKMYKDESHATRAILRIGINSMTQKEMIKDATVITSPTYPYLPAMVEDKMKSSSTYVGVGLGKIPPEEVHIALSWLGPQFNPTVFPTLQPLQINPVPQCPVCQESLPHPVCPPPHPS